MFRAPSIQRKRLYSYESKAPTAGARAVWARGPFSTLKYGLPKLLLFSSHPLNQMASRQFTKIRVAPPRFCPEHIRSWLKLEGAETARLPSLNVQALTGWKEPITYEGSAEVCRILPSLNST